MVDERALAYAADRAAIEDLQARYLFALDWFDAETYGSTFAEDGVLDWAGGIVRGRANIVAECREMRGYFAGFEAAEPGKRPARLRHFITNTTIRVDGDRASSRSFWFEAYNNTMMRAPYFAGYGHYEDELERIDGEWRFTFRKIWNEMMEDRAASWDNPAW